MSTTMKGENKLEAAFKYRAWKNRIYLIVAKQKVLYLVQGKVKKPIDDVGKEKFRGTEILSMNLIVDGLKENLIPTYST